MSIASDHMPKGAAGDVRIGEWRLAPRRNELMRGGEVVRLEPKAAELLAYLAGQPGVVVGREDLLAAVWPGVVVGDDALTQAIIKLRKALGDDAHSPRYIETISKRGYRLIAPVEPPSAPMEPSDERIRHRPRVIHGVVVAMAILVIVAAVLVVPRLPWPIGAASREAAGASSIPTVAVMPLANLSGDPKRDYFSEGVTEDIINALGRFPGVRVIARSAVQGPDGRPLAPRAIRDELGARYLLQGSVREAEGSVRVTVELSDARLGNLLWSQRHEAAGTQLFEVQDRIVRQIVGTLHVELSQIEQERGFTRPTESLEAYDLVLRARALIRRTLRAPNIEARSLLARAAALAPEYAEIYTEMGNAEFQRVTNGWVEDAAQSLGRAEELGRRALSSNDNRAHARAHSLLASLYGHQERYREALGHAQKAVELNPSDPSALYWQGHALLAVGRIDEAMAVLEAARRIDPHPSSGQGIMLGLAYYVAGRYADALAQTDAMLLRNPRLAYTHALRAASLARLGDLEQARRAAGEVRRANPLFDPENFGAFFADPRYKADVRDGLRIAGL